MTNGFTSKWAHLTNTLTQHQQNNALLNLLQQTIRTKLIPKLTEIEALNNTKRKLFALPTRLEGSDAAATAGDQHTMSKSITNPLWIS